MFTDPSGSKVLKAFTLIELSVMFVVVGVFAAFGVPRFIKSVERTKAGEAFSYLSAVRAAQERFHAREGVYASDLASIDIKAPEPKYFRIGTLAAGGTGRFADSWTLTLTRIGTSSGYGTYTVTFSKDGFDASKSSIQGLSEINPLGRPTGSTSRTTALLRP